MLFHTKTTQEVLAELEVGETGLSSTEARERLEEYGPNVITIKGEPLWRKLIEPFANILMGVLLVAALISIWHHALIDAVIIVIIMLVSAVIYYVQRFSTERILRSLQKRDPQKVHVLRENRNITAAAETIVPGDIIILSEGEKIPADARLLSTSSLRVDESQLTGESLPIDKQTRHLPEDSEIYERSNMVYQGSFVIGGEANAVVVATGDVTEFGRIAALSSADNVVKSPVQVKIDRLISHIIAVVAGIALVTFALSLWRGMELAETLRFVLALSVSAVPESLPVAISVVLALGMRRMAAKRALVRNMSAIETIGTLTTIATDKTGTLTKNKLTLLETWSLPGRAAQLTNGLPLTINLKGKAHDPLDTAMHEYIIAHKYPAKKLLAPLAILPFDQSVAMSGNIWRGAHGHDLYVKGAPEHILARCKLPRTDHQAAESALHSMTGRGLRVIALAHATLPRPITSFTELPKTNHFVFDGFIAVADVLRPEAKVAIRTATNAGVTVRMITGDHFETAFHIGRELGMAEHREQVFDCRKLHTMSDAELESIIENVRVFSRVIPEHKHRILTILKKHHITAMTGDGVNDVPALVNAHVGVAMGSGARIAKDAGDIILLDDNFKRIVDAIHEGRTIYANIKRMVTYLLATNLGEVLVSVGSLIIGMPIPLLPVQILWVNLVTDTSMVIPLGLEPGEKRNMNRPPQKPDAPLLSQFMISRIALIALTMAGITLWQYVTFSNAHGQAYGRTIAFCSLVIMQWASALCARSDYEPLWRRIWRFSGAFWIGLAIAVGLQVFAVFGPLSSFLHISSHVSVFDLAHTGIFAFFTPILVVETHKFIGRHWFGKGSRAKPDLTASRISQLSR